MRKEKSKHRKKGLIIFAASVAAIVGTASVIFSVNSSKNSKLINENVNAGLDLISKYYTVTSYEPNEYTDLKMYGLMKFHTDQYRVEGLGNLSVMTMDMGMMQMVSFMITPFEKQLPLCTLDFMYIMGNRKSYVEFYDLVPDPSSLQYTSTLSKLSTLQEEFKDLEELPAKKNWYDDYLTVYMHKSLKDDDTNSRLFKDALNMYLDLSKDMPRNSNEDASLQLKEIETYSDGLIEKGGVSTDFFKKALGKDTTRNFFNKVFFGTDNYR